VATRLKVFSVRNSTRGSLLATNAKLASSYWSRFWGLMLRRRLSDGDGILLTKSSSIHSFFMFFRFDALYLDRDGRVVKVVHAMRPWWISFGGKGSKDTLELPAGTAQRTQTVTGDLLAFEEPIDTSPAA
jgi:uncharacterized membrane protein (UPF0127 family)